MVAHSKGLWILVSLAVLLTVTSGVAAADADGTDHAAWLAEYQKWEEATYEAALKEGRLVWYSVDPKTTQDAIAALWREKYPGIDLVIQSGRGGELGAKVRTEQDANQVVADVLVVATSLTRQLAEEGRIEAFIPPLVFEPGVQWFEDPLRDAPEYDGRPYSIIVAHSPVGVIVNTLLVPEGQEPKSWRDLLDPKWKGNIISHDPRIAGYGARTFYYLRKIYGEPFWQQLVEDQQLVVERQHNLISLALATGEYAIGLALTPRELAIVEGAPLKYYPVSEGTPVSVTGAVIVKGAPHPNAARLFLNMIMSPEGQDILGESGARTPNRVGSRLTSPIQTLEGQQLLVLGVSEELRELPRVQEDVRKYLGE